MATGSGTVAVVHAAPGGLKGAHWGDTHFAASLVEAFGRRGSDAVAYSRYDWDVAATAESCVVLRGLRPFEPPAAARSVLWIISHLRSVTDDELDLYDHVCVASGPAAAALQERTATPVHVLHQATDTRRFRAPGLRPTAATGGVVTVANWRWPSRRGPRWLRQLGIPFRLYGANWDGTPEESFVVARHVPNEHVAGLYASAQLVVADQWDQMAFDGFVANRLFDVAAAGGFVLSDAGSGVGEVFGDLVPTYASRAELAEQVARWSQDVTGRASRSRELRDLVRSEHDFGHRAATLLELLRG